MSELLLPFDEVAQSRSDDQPYLSARQLAVWLRDNPPTDEQVAAIEAPLAPLAVVAGAGSGKTQTMALRVLWLVANGLVPPHRVLGLTFTRKAAGELGLRVRGMLRRVVIAHERDPFLRDDVATALRTGEPRVSTYHSYASALIDEHALRLGLEPATQVIGEAMAWQLAWRVVDAYDGPLETVGKMASTLVQYVLGLSGDLAEHLHTTADLAEHGTRVCARVDAAQAVLSRAPAKLFAETQRARAELLPVVEAYTALKRERGVIDYSDQVALAAQLARDSDEVVAVEQARWGAVLLDEYQDTGESQRVLLTSLFGGGRCVTAVGDPRQSIYGWRGASAGNLQRFGADFGGTTESGLTRSFRNGEAILTIANAVAAELPVDGLAERPLVPGPGRAGAGVVQCALVETASDEATLVADRLVTAHDSGVAWGEMAVLSRKRSAFPRLEQALSERGVPVEVVGLGGLLVRPEVADVVATLQVLGDPTAGSALLRLLGGPRWRLGPRDLARLGERAALLARRSVRADAADPAEPAEAVAPRDADPLVAEYDVVDERSVVDALDDLGPPTAYSAEGYARLVAARDELRELRRWTWQPLPDLVAHVARSTGLDVELAARAADDIDALADLDRLVEEADDFVQQGDNPGLVEFLAYLEAAREQEDGLEVDQPGAPGERVRVMTVHAAKGLEWRVVAVTGMCTKVFPTEGQAVTNWAKQAQTLPFEMRGDVTALPALDWAGAPDGKALVAELERFDAACKARALVEEHRLAYVAVTRPQELLLCTGYWWDETKTPRGPSVLLDLVRAALPSAGGQLLSWVPEPADDAVNPAVADPARAAWPLDPLGSRRAAVEAGAALVRAAVAGTGDEASTHTTRWDDEVELLLAEHEQAGRRSAGDAQPVLLPSTLSVSQLVELRGNPDELARSLRRPVPQPPRPQARRGTRFHLWLEQTWGQQRLLDIDELPGAADETAPDDEDLLALQQAFRDSPWWDRTPHELEVPFDLKLDNLVLRGRIDAVFTDAADGNVDVVDWKTGVPKTGEDAAVAAVQLAVYRLAWHHLTATPLESIRAAFHYVGVNRTVSPADLLGHDELLSLIHAVPAAVSAPDLRR
ncbi:MAG: ATP-dependent helicase UvrD/PcrA [Actinomycetota bacterium]|nr:ATP-dependent helicase UvrD/PcrA [Actinomycetota bacterium]